MIRLFSIAASALLIAGCMSPYGWVDDGYYGSSGYGYGGYPRGSIPVGWWGRDAASITEFYGLLGGYGSWMPYGSYGRVFLPRNVGSGWQPYSRGRWQSDSRHGQMWVSSDPWGWATDHYGRWGHDRKLGWFWVPDTRFGPSWVDWRTTNGQRSWAPMRPQGWTADRHGMTTRRWISRTAASRNAQPRRLQSPSSRPNQVTRPSPTAPHTGNPQRPKAQRPTPALRPGLANRPRTDASRRRSTAATPARPATRPTHPAARQPGSISPEKSRPPQQRTRAAGAQYRNPANNGQPRRHNSSPERDGRSWQRTTDSERRPAGTGRQERMRNHMSQPRAARPKGGHHSRGGQRR